MQRIIGGPHSHTRDSSEGNLGDEDSVNEVANTVGSSKAGVGSKDATNADNDTQHGIHRVGCYDKSTSVGQDETGQWLQGHRSAAHQSSNGHWSRGAGTCD